MALSRKDIQRLGWTVGAVLISLLGGLAIASAAETATKTVTADPTPVAASADTSSAKETKALMDKAEYVGADTCLGCHDEQGGIFKQSIHARLMPARKGVEFQRTCETCHGPGSLHAAAAGDKDNPGFHTIKNLTNLPASEANAACLTCHRGGMQSHWKGSPHDLKDVKCVDCHQVHQAEKTMKAHLLKAEPPELCYGCHTDKKAQMKRSAHMPVREGDINCTSCHNPHGGVIDHNLKGDSVNENCYSCHADKRGPYLWEHAPVRENCLNCHDPHGSHNDHLLREREPLLCQRCHSGSGHPSTEWSGGIGNTQLSQNAARLMVQGCTNCHSNIHGSNDPSGQTFFR